jgi:predicted GNAT family acetyltransferase
MNVLQPLLNEEGEGSFNLQDGEKKIGDLTFRVVGEELTAYHTEVSSEYGGQGLGKKLVEALVDYARSRNLKVRPLCPYVHMVFKRNPEEYNDIWLKKSLGS